jgi:hypothetical protein
MFNFETNPLYQIALETDFAESTDHGALKTAFATAVTRLAETAKKQLVPISSITETARVFHYSMMAAALLQYKAKHRHNEIIETAPPEHSIVNFVKSQLNITKETTEQHSLMPNPQIHVMGLARAMEDDFCYNGKTMRAMAMVSILQLCEGKRNKLMNPATILADYQPTLFLIQSKQYPIIGCREYNPRTNFGSTYSAPHDNEVFTKETRYDFGKVFYNKFVDILTMADMDTCDRARTEEFRDFFADTLCRAFFELRYLNFPRVLNFIDAINRHSDEQGRISEKILINIAPADCTALAGIDFILLKDTVDLDNTLYRVNHGGIYNFSHLAELFNLLGQQKQSLLDKVIDGIKQGANGTA